MRTPTRDRARAMEVDDALHSELLDALPELEELPRSSGLRAWGWLVVRLLGGLSVLAVGAIHLYEYEKLYSAVPTIGTLFLLNFAGATVIGLGLLGPTQRLAGRYGDTLLSGLVIGGIAVAAVAFAFLKISQHTPLFGFLEPGYDPAGIYAAQGAEIVTVVFLCAFLVRRLCSDSPVRRW